MFDLRGKVVEKNKYNCDAYDSGYCYWLGRPLTDEEDDMCEYCCCYFRLTELNKDNNA